MERAGEAQGTRHNVTMTFTPVLSTLYKAIRQWAIGSSGFDSAHVVWSHNPADAPTLPYVYLQVIVDDSISGYDERRYKNTGTEEAPSLTEQMVGPRMMTVSVNVHTVSRGYAAGTGTPNPNTPEAVDVLRKMLSCLTLSSFSDALAVAGIGVLDWSPSRDLTDLVATKFERRVQADIMLSYVTVLTDDTPSWVETVTPPPVTEAV